MPIHAMKGDVVTEGPRRAQALALWLRSGYNEYDLTWQSLVQYYSQSMGRAFRDGEGRISQQPWKAGHDLFDVLGEVEGQQRYLYLFANPADGRDHGAGRAGLANNGDSNDPFDDNEITADGSDLGYSDLATLQGHVTDCLNCLADKKITTVAMIFIPLAAPHDLRGDERLAADDAAARAMVQAIGAWEETHPQHMDVYLFDHDDGFERIANIGSAIGVDLAGFGADGTAAALVERLDNEDRPDIRATLLNSGISQNVPGGADAKRVLATDAAVLNKWCRRYTVLLDSPIDLQGLPAPVELSYLWQLRLRPIDQLYGGMAPLADRLGAVVARCLATLREAGLCHALGSQIRETYPGVSLRRKKLPAPKGWSAVLHSDGRVDGIGSTVKRNDAQLERLEQEVPELLAGLKLRSSESAIKISDHEVDAVVCGLIGISPRPADLIAELAKKFNGRGYVPPRGYVMDMDGPVWWSSISLSRQRADLEPTSKPTSPVHTTSLETPGTPCPAGCGKIFKQWPLGADAHAKSLAHRTKCTGIPVELTAPMERWHWYRQRSL